MYARVLKLGVFHRFSSSLIVSVSVSFSSYFFIGDSHELSVRAPSSVTVGMNVCLYVCLSVCACI